MDNKSLIRKDEKHERSAETSQVQDHLSGHSPFDDDIISGDLFEGIAVYQHANRDYKIKRHGVNGKIVQEVYKAKPDRLSVSFCFSISGPIRLRLDVFVPEDCVNACVTLQDQKLIGYFSELIPIEPEIMLEANCSDGDAVSTLHPGEFQSVNFLWSNGDILKFHFYF